MTSFKDDGDGVGDRISSSKPLMVAFGTNKRDRDPIDRSVKESDLASCESLIDKNCPAPATNRSTTRLSSPQT